MCTVCFIDEKIEEVFREYADEKPHGDVDPRIEHVFPPNTDKVSCAKSIYCSECPDNLGKEGGAEEFPLGEWPCEKESSISREVDGEVSAAKNPHEGERTTLVL